jgi:hypothetical protein
MSRRDNKTIFLVTFIFALAAAILLMSFGCATTEPPPCIPQIKWLKPPIETITVIVTFSVQIPDDPEYKFIDFEHELILTDSEDFIEVVYNDLILCTEKFANAKIELIRIKAAQIAAAEEHGAQTDPPTPD